MSKIIIDNRSSKPDDDILLAVRAVVLEGRVSGNKDKYCYVTTFRGGFAITARRNKASDTFIAWDEK